MSNKNPWRGLAFYEENDGYLFCGRDEETHDMVRLIDNNLFVTLYGSSGTGKTSLLKAGVIPILRKKDYFPLYVRLSQEPKELTYAEAIVRKLQASALNEECSVKLNYSNGSDRLYLWNYFATTRFRNAEGREVYPVVILDQFEEMFRDEDKRKAELLLQQVYLLLNDEVEMPNSDGYNTETNYRFVASIREDFLFVLEDGIDEFSLDLYKNNRYRLRPMKAEKAKEVVLMPGKDCIEESEKDKVAKRVVSLAGLNVQDDEESEQGDIDTLLLSLVCAGTYDKKNGAKIASKDLDIWKNNPMEVYYQDAIKGLSANQVRYIQQHLIREDGSRKQVNAEEVKAALGNNTFEALTRYDRRMIVLGEQGQVELLHDKLALAVFEERKAFEEREKKKRLRRRMSLAGLAIFVIGGVFLFQYQRLKEQRTQLDESQWKMMENQSRFVAEKALSIAEEDSYLARLLALEVLPEDLNNPNRPYTSDAEFVLRSSSLFRKTFLKGHTMNINDIQFSQDGSLIASGADDNKIIVWNTNTGGIIATLDANQGPVNHVSFSADNKKIVSIVGFGKIIAWDVFSKKTITSFHVDAKNVTFDDEGENIIAISKDSIFVWNLASEKYISQIPLELPIDIDNHYVFSNSLSISFLNKNEIRYSNSHDGYSYVFDITTGKVKEKMQVYRTHSYSRHNNLDAVTNGSKIAFVANNNTIMLLDTEPENTYTYQFHNQSVNSVSYSSDGKYIVSTSEDSTICIIDATNRSLIRRMKARNSIPGVAFFDTEGDKVVSTTQNKYICIWELANNGYSVTQLPMHNNRVVDIHISPDSKWILSTSQDSTIVITNATSHEFYYNLKTQSQVSCGTFSPDGIHFAFCASGQVFIYDIESGEEKNSFPAHSSKATGIRTYSGITSICYSPDGKHLITSSYDNSAAVWDVNTGKCIVELKGHIDYVNSANIDYSGNYIVTASDDNMIKIWIAKTGAEVMSIKTNSAVNYASFKPDGKVIVSAHDDGTIHIWDFPPLQELIDQTRKCFKDRPLTAEERRMYYLE